MQINDPIEKTRQVEEHIQVAAGMRVRSLKWYSDKLK
jgi:hypothetical protein